MFQLIRALFAAALLILSIPQLAAQSYPTKPVMVKVAYPAGGPADSAARKMQVQLQAALGQPVVVENVPGAGGSIGARNVLNAPADGYTLLVTTGNDAILAPLTLASARYKAEDLRLIHVLIPAEFVLVSNSKLSFKNVDEFVDHARKSGQRETTFGSWGYGSIPHLVGEDFRARTASRILDVPYKGVAPVVQDLLGSQVDMAFLPLGGNILGLIETGKVRAIGIAAAKRSSYLPNVPTLNESRYLKDFHHLAWGAVFVARATPEAIAATLNKHIAEVVGGTEYQKYLRDTAAVPVEPTTLAQAAAFYKAETEKLTNLARAVKIQPQ
jgi:tripartite-type tricarboxylate transporter receptor subunit TctC